jgi:beta-galactosidase
VIGGFTLAGAAGAAPLTGWQVYILPLDAKMLAGLKYRDAQTKPGPAFWRARVEVARPGDTFLDMRPWGKGVAWVNGHCLGRFWNIGPAQTLYVPGPWLKSGQNEVVILDLPGPEKPEVAGLDTPILNQLRPELEIR